MAVFKLFSFDACKRLPRALFLCAFCLMLTACETDLYTKLSESEANEMVAVLVKNGIKASRITAKDGTSTLRIDEGSVTDAVSILVDSGYPRTKFATIGEVFADTKLVSTPTEERARFIYAISQELEKTLSQIDGVISARVHVVLPKNDPLREDQRPSSAAVFIKHDPAIDIAGLVPQIKLLVTNSIEGLIYEKVTIVLVPGTKNIKASADQGGASQFENDPQYNYYLPVIGGAAGLIVGAALLAMWYRRRPRRASAA